MTREAVDSPVAGRAVSPGLVALAVVIPTFMEVLDTTIANVALRYLWLINLAWIIPLIVWWRVEKRARTQTTK